MAVGAIMAAGAMELGVILAGVIADGDNAVGAMEAGALIMVGAIAVGAATAITAAVAGVGGTGSGYGSVKDLEEFRAAFALQARAAQFAHTGGSPVSAHSVDIGGGRILRRIRNH